MRSRNQERGFIPIPTMRGTSTQMPFSVVSCRSSSRCSSFTLARSAAGKASSGFPSIPDVVPSILGSADVVPELLPNDTNVVEGRNAKELLASYFVGQSVRLLRDPARASRPRGQRRPPLQRGHVDWGQVRGHRRVACVRSPRQSTGCGSDKAVSSRIFHTEEFLESISRILARSSTCCAGR